MFRQLIRPFVLLASFAPALLYAQHSMPEKSSAPMHSAKASDAKKIADAMSAAPAEIAKHATIMDWPEKEGAQPRQLRAGTNGWVCMPSDPSGPGGDPMCLDKQWQAWADGWMTKTQPKITATGIAYMLRGDRGSSNTDPYATGPTATNEWIEAPPHIMVVYPDPKMLEAFPTDPKNGGPWVMWKGTPYAHLMVPVSPTKAAKMPAFAPARAKAGTEKTGKPK